MVIIVPRETFFDGTFFDGVEEIVESVEEIEEPFSSGETSERTTFFLKTSSEASPRSLGGGIDAVFCRRLLPTLLRRSVVGTGERVGDEEGETDAEGADGSLEEDADGAESTFGDGDGVEMENLGEDEILSYCSKD